PFDVEGWALCLLGEVMQWLCQVVQGSALVGSEQDFRIRFTVFLHRFEAGRPVLAHVEPVARELASAGLRSRPKHSATAARLNGRKLPRHSGSGSSQDE
ncbi:hypothetical protein B7L09_27160, partial [Pseudomonas mandelii]